MKIGLIGLGNMGYNLMLNLLDHGHEVVAWNRSVEKREKARKESKAVVVDSIEDLVKELDGPRAVISMISAGDAVDKMLFGDDGESGLKALLQKDDIFVDMVNSHYLDSQRRSTDLAEKGIKMLDAGISGGVNGARHGACMMIGGDKDTFDKLEEIFKDATIENGYGYFGPAGAGHFVKMVHNGIEYGMMQSIAEGISMVEAREDFNTDMVKLLDVWNHGSIIESKLVGFLQEAYEEGKGSIDKEEDEIGDLGTGKWTAVEALNMGIPLPNITNAVYARYNSRLKDSKAWKAVSAMRRIFGAHSAKDRAN